MSDLKEFWDEQENDCKELNPSLLINTKKIREAQGYFFWERGGKRFVYRFVYENGIFHKKKQRLTFLIPLAKISITKSAQNFLDSIDCLGEDKIKELIKRVEKNE